MVAWKERVSSYSYMHFSAELIVATSFPELLLEAVQSSRLCSNISTSDLIVEYCDNIFLCWSSYLTLMLSCCRRRVEMVMTAARAMARRSQEEPGSRNIIVLNTFIT